MMEERGTKALVDNSFHSYGGYRMYCTPEYWLITYRDADFIRIMRGTAHRPGFGLLCLEVIFGLLRGVRTDLRDRWALYKDDWEGDARMLGLEARASVARVIELELEGRRVRMKGKNDDTV